MIHRPRNSWRQKCGSYIKTLTSSMPLHCSPIMVLERCLGQTVKLFHFCHRWHTCVLDGRFLSAAMDKESSWGVNQGPHVDRLRCAHTFPTGGLKYLVGSTVWVPGFLAMQVASKNAVTFHFLQVQDEEPSTLFSNMTRRTAKIFTISTAPTTIKRLLEKPTRMYALSVCKVAISYRDISCTVSQNDTTHMMETMESVLPGPNFCLLSLSTNPVTLS